MHATEDSAHEDYRVVVFGRHGSEILLTRSDAGLRFPEVAIPQWQRVAENVTIAMKEQWGAEVVCLFELEPIANRGNFRYLVARHWRALGQPAAQLLWIPVYDLSEHSFAEANDYQTLQEALVRSSPRNAGAGPCARLNWFDEVCHWIGKAIQPKGLHLTGNFRQLNASETFSLIRLETDGRAVWFKAVGEPNEREFPITLTLARLFPKYIPEPIATRPDWNGWLTFETDGISLADTTDLSLWESASAAIARLQIESITNCRTLLHSGAHDLKAPSLATFVSPFMDVIAELMSHQPKAPPAILSTAELNLLEQRISNAILDLEELGIPDTLGHSDLNPGNIVLAPDACVFLDWTEAYVGHPFYSFQYLRQHFRHASGENSAGEAGLTAAYLASWKEVARYEALTEAMTLSPLVAAFAYAAGTGSWREPERLRDSRFAGYLRALARRMSREAELLSEGRASCLS